MRTRANYIRRIEIQGLWNKYNIAWDLRPDVNILSGVNGVGKTTILNRSVTFLESIAGEATNGVIDGVHLDFDPADATYIVYDFIRSYDRPLIQGDFTARMADKNVKSELDWQIYLMEFRFLMNQTRATAYRRLRELCKGPRPVLIKMGGAHSSVYKAGPELSVE